MRYSKRKMKSLADKPNARRGRRTTLLVGQNSERRELPRRKVKKENSEHFVHSAENARHAGEEPSCLWANVSASCFFVLVWRLLLGAGLEAVQRVTQLPC